MARKFRFISKKKKERTHLFSAAEDFLESGGIKGPRTEILSNREITVEGCCGVFEYTDTYMKLNLGKGALILCGTDFDIVLFENRTITVRGNLLSVEFCV